MTRAVIDFTRPVPSDLAPVEELVLRFARWTRSTGARAGTDTSGLGRRYDPSEDSEWRDPRLVRLQALEGLRIASGAPREVLAPLAPDEALAVSRAWQLLPTRPVDLGRVLQEHYLRDKGNVFAAARGLGIDASDWCSARDTALRMLRHHLRAYQADPKAASTTWGRAAAAMRGFTRSAGVPAHFA